MSLHRFIASHAVTGSLTSITGPELHHLRTVLRLGPGDHLIVNDPEGGEYAAVVESVTSEEAVARVLAPLESRGVLPVTLFQSILKGQKMDLVIQKATELGVAEIVPLEAVRSVAKVEHARVEAKLERWRRIAAEASKQSGRPAPPSIGLPVTVSEASARIGGFDVCVVFWEETKEADLAEALASAGKQSRLGAIVGPEGGFTAEEVEALQKSGALRAGLGPLTLRSETAAIAAVVLLTYELRRKQAADG